MKNFRQKLFTRSKKFIKSGFKFIKDHPILPISTASLGVGIANYKTNTKRQEEGKEQHKEQLEALKNLNDSIVKNSETLKIVNQSLQTNSRNLELSKEEKDKSKPRRTLLLFRRRNFSIESGGFYNRSVKLNNKDTFKSNLNSSASEDPAVELNNFDTNISLAKKLNKVVDNSVFNLELFRGSDSRKLFDYIESHYRTKSNHVFLNNSTKTLFSLDSDPKDYLINLFLKDNVLVMFVNNPTYIDLKKLNTILDNYCKSYKLADYKSEKLGKNTYLIEVNTVHNSEGSLVISMIESKLKVNILTIDNFGINNN